MNTNMQREMAFLRYLDALENGDIDALADCLALAERDPQLEQMLLDYHTQENTMNYRKLVPYPLNSRNKRKRGEQWLSPVAAALLLVLVGLMAGLVIVLPHGGNNMAAVIAPTTPIITFGYGGQVDTLDSEAIDAMQRANMAWVKFQVRYRQGDTIDSMKPQIDIAHANGFRVLLNVVGMPDELHAENYFDSYGRFVGALAGYGADAIEIWNEPNLDREWLRGEIDPAHYTKLLNAAYVLIKENNPNTFVITAGLAPTGAEMAFPSQVMNDDNYLRGMVEAGALNYADCIGVHYVEGVVPPWQSHSDPRDDYYTRYYQSMVDTYQAITLNQIPLCFTELGYLTPDNLDEPLPPYFAWAEETSLAEQALWLDAAIQMAAESEQVRILIVWNMNHQDEDSAGFSLIRPDGTCPACAVLGSNDTPSMEETCYAEVVNRSNVIYLLESDWVDYPMQVGVNERFLIVAPAIAYDNEYYILFNGEAARIAMEDVHLIGDCTEASFPIFAYPN
jgi:hypothetical protein